MITPDLAPEFELIMRIAASRFVDGARVLDWPALVICVRAYDTPESKAWVLAVEALHEAPASVVWRGMCEADPAPRGQRTPCPSCKALRGVACAGWCAALPARREGEWRVCQALLEAAAARAS